MNWVAREEEEIKKICKEYEIDMKNRKLPYKEKIQQICNSLSAFHRYKRDQREVLDFSNVKNPEFINAQIDEFENLKTLLRF